MEKLQNTVLPEHLEMNETEKNLLTAEEEKYGKKLVEMSKDQKYRMCNYCFSPMDIQCRTEHIRSSE